MKTFWMKRQFVSILFIAFYLLCNSLHLFAQAEYENAEKTTCGGTERWAVKVLTDSNAAAIHYTPITTTISALCALTTPSAGTSTPRFIGLEYTTYRVVCNVIAKRNETDNDYHLELSNGTDTMVGEIPDPVCSQAALSAHVSEYIACRNFVNTNIGTGTVLSVSIPPVVVTGVAFVDIPHGVSGAAPNNLELHPILDIHFAGGTGIQNFPEPLLSVTVTPNPFTNKIAIKALLKKEIFSNCYFQLYDSYANKVVETPINVIDKKEINTQIDISELNKGVYIYRIMNNGDLIYDGKLECIK